MTAPPARRQAGDGPPGRGLPQPRDAPLARLARPDIWSSSSRPPAPSTTSPPTGSAACRIRSPWTPTGRRGPTAACSGPINSLAGHRARRPAQPGPGRDGGLRPEPLPHPRPAHHPAADARRQPAPTCRCCSSRHQALPASYWPVRHAAGAHHRAGRRSALGFYTFVLLRLHARPAQRDPGGRDHRRGRPSGNLHPGDPAADQARSGRARRAVVHLDLQRPAVGDHLSSDRRQYARHPGAARSCRGSSCRRGASSPPGRSSPPSPRRSCSSCSSAASSAGSPSAR